MRAAIIDLGTCTFHALVADVDPHGIHREIYARKEELRIGAHAFATGAISDVAYQRGLETVVELATRVRKRVNDPIRIVATSVFREAANGPHFVAEAAARTGLAIELLGGHEEARLSWLAVSTELACSHGALAVLDLGGGSLECALGTYGLDIARSLPLGALRLREHTPAELRAHVERVAAPAAAELGTVKLETVAVTSGTAKTLLGVARKLGLVAERQRHVSARMFFELARKLPGLGDAALLQLGVPTSRLDTIATGAIVLSTMLDMLGRPVVYIGRTAMREGGLIDLAQQQRRSANQLRFSA